MFVKLIRPEEVSTVFPVVTDILIRIPRLVDRYSLEDVCLECKAGAWQLWVIGGERIYAALLTTIISYPKRRELVLLGIAGVKMKDWIHMLPEIEDFGRVNNCDRVAMTSVREGFRRVLPGYAGNRISLEKVL